MCVGENELTSAIATTAAATAVSTEDEAKKEKISKMKS